MPERSQLATSFLPVPGSEPVEWRIEPGLTDYATALAFMEQRAEAIRSGAAGEMVWLVEHPPLYTAGTSAQPADLIDPDRFPVYAAGRGGEYTYHARPETPARGRARLRRGA
jgi:lipoyl(octanoyl) transferase